VSTTLPKEMSWLDAPHDISNDNAHAWSKGWNACRLEVERAALARAGQQADGVEDWKTRMVKYGQTEDVAIRAELADLRAQLASAQIDAARYRYIEDNCSTQGGGRGFAIDCFVPVDEEDMGVGIDKAIAARAQITNTTATGE